MGLRIIGEPLSFCEEVSETATGLGVMRSHPVGTRQENKTQLIDYRHSFSPNRTKGTQ